jgi:UPF0755 protein
MPGGVNLKFFGTLLVVLLVLAAAVGFLLYVPYGPSTETFVELPSGSGGHSIATRLQQGGVIRSRYAFYVLRLLKGRVLKAGEYRFDHPATMVEVYDRIARGDVYTLTLSIPEGYNIFDIATAVEAAGLGSRDGFLAAEREHTELIAPWTTEAGAHPVSLEGYLFPDTYHFSRHSTPLQMLTAMVHRFSQESTALGLHGPEVTRTVILASLVEKEVSQAGERPLVAGVFVNRLAKGIPLATDPSVAYAALLEGRWRGTIFASDLQSASAYNTYKHAGLPPGPICSPGLAALRAAMHPAETDYLYFVSDAAGHSRFSTTLKEHDANVQAYRRAQQH